MCPNIVLAFMFKVMIVFFFIENLSLLSLSVLLLLYDKGNSCFVRVVSLDYSIDIKDIVDF